MEASDGEGEEEVLPPSKVTSRLHRFGSRRSPPVLMF